MKDMDKVVDCFDLVIWWDEKIFIYGDYDVDGIMLVFFFYQFLQDVGYCFLEFYILDCYKEGYGLLVEGVVYVVEQGVLLFIMVDCGIWVQE